MSNFEFFMADKAEKIKPRKVVVSERFKDAGGKPIEWEFTPIDAGENDKIRAACYRSIPVPGNRGQYSHEFDGFAYLSKLAARCTTYPDLNNAKLQDSYGVHSAEELIKTMLLPGELDGYSGQISEIINPEKTFEEEVSDIKK